MKSSKTGSRVVVCRHHGTGVILSAKIPNRRQPTTECDLIGGSWAASASFGRLAHGSHLQDGLDQGRKRLPSHLRGGFVSGLKRQGEEFGRWLDRNAQHLVSPLQSASLERALHKGQSCSKEVPRCTRRGDGAPKISNHQAVCLHSKPPLYGVEETFFGFCRRTPSWGTRKGGIPTKSLGDPNHTNHTIPSLPAHLAPDVSADSDSDADTVCQTSDAWLGSWPTPCQPICTFQRSLAGRDAWATTTKLRD